MIRRSLLALLMISTIAACSAAGPGAASPAGTASPADAPTPSPTSARPSFALSPPPLATVGPSSSPVVGEVPPAIMAAATVDLATKTGLDPSTFVTVRSEQVIWADGSLGCPEPGHMYTQVLTPGYWIQIQAGGKTYDYRSPNGGPVRLCELASPKPPTG